MSPARPALKYGEMPGRSLVRAMLLCAVEGAGGVEDGGRAEGGAGTALSSLLTAGAGTGSAGVESKPVAAD